MNKKVYNILICSSHNKIKKIKENYKFKLEFKFKLKLGNDLMSVTTGYLCQCNEAIKRDKKELINNTCSECNGRLMPHYEYSDVQNANGLLKRTTLDREEVYVNESKCGEPDCGENCERCFRIMMRERYNAEANKVNSLEELTTGREVDKPSPNFDRHPSLAKKDKKFIEPSKTVRTTEELGAMNNRMGTRNLSEGNQRYDKPEELHKDLTNYRIQETGTISPSYTRSIEESDQEYAGHNMKI